MESPVSTASVANGSALFSPLLKRVLFSGMAAGLLASLLFSFLQSRRAYFSAKEEALRHVKEMEAILEPQLELALWNLDRASVDRAIEVMAREPHVTGVEIKGSGMPLAAKQSGKTADWTTLRFPLVYEGRGGRDAVGSLEIGLSSADIYGAAVGQAESILAYNLAGFLVLSLVICFLFHQLVTKELLEIERSTEAFNKAHLEPILGANMRPAGAPAETEIRQLARSIQLLQENFVTALRLQHESEAGKAAAEGQLERERQKLKLMQRLNSIGEIAAYVIHDFRNLMLVTRGHLDRLKRQLSDKDPSRASADDIDVAIERAYALVSKILSLTRVQEAKLRKFDPDAVVSGIERVLRTAVGKKVAIEFSFEEQHHAVLADPLGLENALLNLCVNARDAMPGGGRIEIRTASETLQDGAFWKLSVSDTGSGIAPEIQGQIFDPFFTTKAPGEGTGLGLSQVSEFCREASGRVEVASSPKGAVFTIRLPALPDSGDALSAL
jgi:signal transduction histidine kinase